VIYLAETILKEDELRIKNKQLKVKKSFNKNIPKILADPKQLSIVFQNLLGNAIKYTPKRGKIDVQISLKGDNILIGVKDTGIGIPKEAQEFIFTRFFRADNAKETEPEGAGLGLYILKSIISQMEGKIWFKSRVNQGTAFYVTLPVKYEKTK